MTDQLDEITEAIDKLMELVKITTWQKGTGVKADMSYVSDARTHLLELIKEVMK